MLLEPIRMVADWLARGINAPSGALNGTSSVNALLAGVPRDAGDALPASVTVYDATRHDWVARLHVGYENSGILFPALAVYVAQDMTMDGEPDANGIVRRGKGDLVIMSITQAQGSAAASVAALYTTRAVMRSLKLFSAQMNQGALYDTVCRRNSVAILGCEQLRLVHPAFVKDGIVLHSGVVATYNIRDEAP